MSLLKHKFKKTKYQVSGGMKINLARIAQKIKEFDDKNKNGKGHLRISDMIRGMVTTSCP